MPIKSARTKKQIPSDAEKELFKILEPFIFKQYKSEICAKCGGKMPIINKMEDFPLIEYQPFFDSWEDEEGKYHSIRAIDLCIQEVYCENNHENILQVMIPYDLILDQVDEKTFNNIMSSLGKADRA
jgi:hypothetical protein